MAQKPYTMKRIIAIAYNDCVSLDLTGPLEAFNYVNLIANEELSRTDYGYHIEIIAKTLTPIKTMSGIKIHADKCFQDNISPVDIILIPGMKYGSTSFIDDSLPEWLALNAEKSERIVSVCSGALILAHSGILSDHKIITHWNSGEFIRKNFNDIQVDDSKIYCKSGNIYSSAGVTAGIDLALFIIEEDFGRAMALKVAKRMVVYLKRDGDQNQFSSLLASQVKAKRFTKLIDWIDKSLALKLSIALLAQKCSMSPRNFSRNFMSDIGYSPMQYVNTRRLEWARRLLEETDLSITGIAKTTGFEANSRLTSAFRGAFHISPSQYRNRFR